MKELIEDMIERLDASPSETSSTSTPIVEVASEPVPVAEGKGRLAIVVGHTKVAPGAFGIAPISQSEYPWNKELAAIIAEEATRQGHSCKVFFRDGVGIPGAYAQVDAFDPDAVMELHFNAANGQARGTETLRGIQPEAAEWAECVHDSMVSLYGRVGRRDRGIKKLKSGDRGHQSVSQLEDVPSLITEPFFGDNADDARLGQEKKKELGTALASAFNRFMQNDAAPGRTAGQPVNTTVAIAASVQLPAELRLEMGKQIVKFEARRDNQGRIAVYKLPKADGGGTYEVAGINDRYHPEKVRQLRDLIAAGKHEEAELQAAEYIATYTDRVDAWVKNPGVEFYLRDSAFNRGPRGAAKILQLALNVPADGKVGEITLGAASQEEGSPPDPKRAYEFLKKLRAAREEYEVRYVGRREIFWKGLVNRWDNALRFAETLVER